MRRETGVLVDPANTQAPWTRHVEMMLDQQTRFGVGNSPLPPVSADRAWRPHRPRILLRHHLSISRRVVHPFRRPREMQDELL
nr:hypothetical protein CFP56_37278 [Quercus suber]